MQMMRNGATIDLDQAISMKTSRLNYIWNGEAIAKLVGMQASTLSGSSVLSEAVGTYMANLGMYCFYDDCLYIRKEDMTKVIRMVIRDLNQAADEITA